MTWACRTIFTLISATLLLLILAMVRQPRPQQDPQPASPPSVDVNPDGAEPAIPDDELEGRAQRAVEGSLRNTCAVTRCRGPNKPSRNESTWRSLRSTSVFRGFSTGITRSSGSITELGQAALGTLEDAIESRLFAALQERIGTATETVAGVMHEEMRTEIEDWVRRESQTVPDGVMTTYERMLEVTVAATVERFTVSAVPSALVAVGTGVGSTVAVAVLAKALAKKIVASAAVKTAGKVGGGIGGRLGGAAAGAAVGSVLGPFGAVAGGVVGGAAAWLAVDGAVVNIDEYLNREDLERVLIALVDEQKASDAGVMHEEMRTEIEDWVRRESQTVPPPPPPPPPTG